MRTILIEKINELIPLLRRQAERLEAKVKKAGMLPHTLGDEKDTATFLDEVQVELNSLDASARNIMGAAYRRALEPLTYPKK